MASVNIGTLLVRIRASTAQFDKGLGRAAARMRRFGRNMGQAGQSLTRAISLPLSLLGGGALKASIDFEDSMADVRKTVQGTESELAGLERTITDMSNSLPISAGAIAKVAEEAGRLGIRANDMEFFADKVIRLAETSTLSLEEAAIRMARLAKITQLPISQIDRLANTVTVLGSELAANENEITDFGLRIAAAGKLSGLTEAQTLGLAAGLSELGIAAERGGTAVSKLLTALAEAVASGGSELESFAATAGLSVSEFVRLFETNAQEAIVRFIRGLGQVNSASTSAFKVLESTGLAGERLKQVLLTAATAGDSLRTAIEKGTTAFRENAKLTDLSNIKFATTASQLKIVRNQVVNAARSLGDDLKPILIDILGVVRDGVLPALRGMVKWFKELEPTTRRAIILFAGMLAAIGPIKIVIGALVGALAAMLNPLTLVAVAAGAVVGVLSQLESGFSAAQLASFEFAKDVKGAAEQTSALGRQIRKTEKDLDFVRKMSARGPSFAKLFEADVKASEDMLADLQRLFSESQVNEAMRELRDGVEAANRKFRSQEDVVGGLQAKYQRAADMLRIYQAAQNKLAEVETPEATKQLAKVSRMTAFYAGLLEELRRELDKASQSTASGASAQAKALAEVAATWGDYTEAMKVASSKGAVFGDTLAATREQLSLTQQQMTKMLQAAGGDLSALAEHEGWQKLREQYGLLSERVLVQQNAWSLWLEKMRESFGGMQETINTFATLTNDLFVGLADGIGNSVGRAIVFGEDLGEAVTNAVKNMASNFISALVSMGLQLIAFGIISKIFGKDRLGATVAVESSRGAAAAHASVLAALPFPANVIAAPLVAAAQKAMIGAYAVLHEGGLAAREGFAFIRRNEVVAPFSDVVDLATNGTMGGGRVQLNLYMGGRKIAEEHLRLTPGIVNRKIGGGGIGR